ncbi:MAG: holo-ACP synthase [Candidatus Azotimanducaceae bacterium]|nr:holo-ACP synthase [Gammaproteobacteria bacterium]
MIVGIGVDIVQVSRVEHLIDKWGEKFALRILSDEELSSFSGNKIQTNFLSKQFAAKEAVSKALGTGLKGIRLSEISVLRDKKGKPFVKFSGRAAVEALVVGAKYVHVSIADERDYAIAYVIIDK